jgi:protease I
MGKTKKVLILAADLYEDMELWYPKIRMKEAGHQVVVAAKEKKSYTGKKGYPVQADIAFSEVNPDEYAALIIPGGYAPDILRRYSEALEIVRSFDRAHKPVAAICHAAWVPVSAGIVKGKRMTCFFAVKDDVINAGAHYVDQEVVIDGNLISSRTPDDLPAFCKAILGAMQEQS